MLNTKKQHKKLEEIGSNLKETIVHANRQLANALGQDVALSKEKPKEEVLIKFVKIIRTKKRVHKGSKGKQNNLPTKVAKNLTFEEERNAILKKLNLKPLGKGKKIRAVSHKLNAFHQKSITTQKTMQCPQLKKLTKKVEESMKPSPSQENFEIFMQGLSCSPPVNIPKRSVDPGDEGDLKHILSSSVEMDLSLNLATICELEQNLEAFRELFVLLVVKHPHLRGDVMKLAQENDSFKELQLYEFLSMYKIQESK